MGKSIRVNKQTTIVSVNTRTSCPPKKRNRGKRQTNDYIEEACGVIFQKSDAPPQVYFRAVGVLPSASLLLQNDSNCEMEAIIQMRTKEITQTIRQSQQVSIVLPSLTRLTIRWAGGESQVCRGRYNIVLRHRQIRRKSHA
ncbi:S-Ena type endospore appendage [Paenibacillus aurantiacus]|uniref:S-Ena type endospore appendage n=1 Tax=Paenibacillus aurantiacus TaxID=1936118 RepID=A0ABV5L010_9BACL